MPPGQQVLPAVAVIGEVDIADAAGVVKEVKVVDEVGFSRAHMVQSKVRKRFFSWRKSIIFSVLERMWGLMLNLPTQGMFSRVRITPSRPTSS